MAIYFHFCWILLSHMVTLYGIFWGIAKLFSIVTAVFHIPIRRFFTSSPVFSFSFFIAILRERKWYLIVVLICIYLITNEGASLVAQTVNRLLTVQEAWVRSLGKEDPLEKGMATHSSIHACKIPWTKEPGGLQSMGLQRVGHWLSW